MLSLVSVLPDQTTADKARQDKIYFESARHITIQHKLQEAFEPTIKKAHCSWWMVYFKQCILDHTGLCVI